MMDMKVKLRRCANGKWELADTLSDLFDDEDSILNVLKAKRKRDGNLEVDPDFTQIFEPIGFVLDGLKAKRRGDGKWELAEIPAIFRKESREAFKEALKDAIEDIFDGDDDDNKKKDDASIAYVKLTRSADGTWELAENPDKIFDAEDEIEAERFAQSYMEKHLTAAASVKKVARVETDKVKTSLL